MNLIEKMMLPLSLSDLRQHYDEKRCLVLEGKSNKFSNLITPADIERRLNDGCNANVFVQTIKDGVRLPRVESNCCWTPASLHKTEFLRDLEDGLSFMMANSSQINPQIAQLVTEIETYFTEEAMHADVHLYVSTDASGKSYAAHRDVPQHKILLQSTGTTHWQIFEPNDRPIPDNLRALSAEEQDTYLHTVAEFDLTQGDLLYMPPGTFHRVVSVAGPRISISIPFYSMESASPMDRTFIPFERVFSQGSSRNPD